MIKDLRRLHRFLVPVIVLLGSIDALSLSSILLGSGPSDVLFNVSALLHPVFWILFLVWFYRAHSNLERGGVGYVQFGHWWTWAGFLVPFMNLFRPIQMMKETLWGSMDLRQLEDRVATEGSFARGNTIINLWWLGFIAAVLVDLFFVPVDADWVPAMAVRDTLLILSKLSLALVVTWVTRLQHAAAQDGGKLASAGADAESTSERGANTKWIHS